MKSRKHLRLLAIVGVFIIVVSSVLVAMGGYNVVIGLSPAASRASVNFVGFAGVVMSLAGVFGLIMGGALLRWVRR